MAEIILQEELCLAVNNNSFIKNGIESCCEGMKYDFRLCNRILKADFRRPIEINSSSADDSNAFIIKPGEVVFVMTEEILELPNNVFCQLSAKRKLSHDGIIILGGFTIDPNYKGKLIFGLYNISSKEFPIIPGKKLVAGIFYKLNKNDTKGFTTIPEPLYDFPDELVRLIGEYKSVANESLLEEICALRSEFKILKEQIDSDKTWKDEFKKGLDQNNVQISKLGLALEEIANDLKTEIDTRQKNFTELKSGLSFFRGIGIVLGCILGSGGVALLVAWLTGILNIGN